MAKPQENLSQSIPEKWAFDYFSHLKVGETPALPDAAHILNPLEIKALRNVRRRALALAFGFGALGVLSLYLPNYLFPHWFGSVWLDLPWLGKFAFPWAFTLYGLLLAITEIIALTLLNLKTVRRMANICGFPRPQDLHYQQHIRILFEVSLEKPSTQILGYGINPYEGLSKWRLFLFNTLNMLKATLSNMLVKVVLGRILARFAIRAYVDLVGIPIFGAWNVYAANRVIREAKVRIMAPNLINRLTQLLYQEFKNHAEFKANLYDAIKFIVIVKRDFHHNHYLLADSLIRAFDLQIENHPALTREQIIQNIKKLDKDAREGLAKLFILGMIIDGNLTRLERQVLLELSQKDELLDFDFRQLWFWEKSFIAGRGLENLFAAKLIRNE
jgi:hypothetical protein